MAEGGVVPGRVDVYDTTLRDGSQQGGMSLTVEDKVRIAEQLDALGVHYIEGGFAGSNPKDDEFFRRFRDGEEVLHHSQLVAFAMTRRAGGRADDDPIMQALLEAGTDVVCIVGKAWDYHVLQALQTTLDEGVAMVRDSIEWLVANGRRVFLDAEHFFDGYKRNPEFSMRVLHAAEEAGAEVLVLCDTNGGTLPHDAARIVGEVRAATSVQIGVHFHDDGGTAVANTLAGVLAGATQVQGCVNGYGERTGNANLCSIIPDLTLKMGVETIPRDRFELLTPVAHHISELVNIAPNPQSPFVGASAFAHKSGIHTSAIARARDAYEHVDPDLVGNGTRFVLSEQAGRSTVELKAREVGLDLDGPAMARLLDELKTLEHRGYHFEAADGSLELLMRTATGWTQDFFEIESFRVITEQRDNGSFITEATIKVHVGDARIVATAEGNGPVNALDGALRSAIGQAYPSLASLHLTDYKVRVLDTQKGTGAVTRVLIDSTDGERTWSTIGVSENIIEASWQALSDSIVYSLLQTALDGTPAD
ncbi:MAG TPA: citramalate synthase [Acidimicrobiales bacterium]|nr:citramalate synthase [Acidimicrobiales bacterium]